MDLFEMVNGHAFPSVHALLIEPFKSMWENDTSDARAECIKDFTYIELLCSPKKSNPFFGYKEEIRPMKVKENVYGDPGHEVTEEIILGINVYKEFLTLGSPSYQLLTSTLNAAGKLENYFNTFNLSERTPSGAMVIKPADVTRALKEVPDVTKSLTLAREKVHYELIEEAKNRNNREIGEFEN